MSRPEPAVIAPDHSALEDVQALLTGTLLCALGLQFLGQAGLITGQTAGLALVISYASGWPFGVVFFLINLPFYWIGYRRIGLAFTVKSFVSVCLLAGLSALLPKLS